ncbi:hypothetical protein F8O04_12055 [Pseudoclavibacter endophyticus]|uniref:Uncharacterized protein n=2 Tax=Pseudoclavibacter endophyticus TaxID=1778590 RepID=A0A6H9WQR4_9MICO|nr:hypothetical protein F8O04_12055 [Pseudoclavibacter endophyticus]
MSAHDFEGASLIWAEVLAGISFDDARRAGQMLLRERTNEDRRPIVPGDILDALRRLDEPTTRVERERRRAIENAEAERAWEEEKAARAQHGGESTLARLMREEIEKARAARAAELNSSTK